MTCVAYKDGFLISDSEIEEGKLRSGCGKKITTCKDGSLAGAAGDMAAVAVFLKWARGGFKADKRPDLTAANVIGMRIEKRGTVTFYENDMRPYPVDAPFHAIGSGQWVAIGAMAAGASAQEAVEIACQYVHGCGGPLQVAALHN